jgi:hypothetical protein
MRNIKARFLGAFLICVCLLAVNPPLSLLADKQSHYRVAKECAEWSLPEKQYFEFFDQLMADSIKKQIANSPKLRGH